MALGCDHGSCRIAAERVGAPVHRCLFIDDTTANVFAAREAGMTALHHRQIEDLQDALSTVLDDFRFGLHRARGRSATRFLHASRADGLSWADAGAGRNRLIERRSSVGVLDSDSSHCTQRRPEAVQIG